MFPAGQKGIHYLRTQAEALALKAELDLGKSVHGGRRRRGRSRDCLFGGGAWRQDHGNGNCTAHPGAGLRRGNLRAHPRASPRPGVDIRLATGRPYCVRCPRRLEIDTNTGIAVNADLIVVGVGIMPEDALRRPRPCCAGRHRGGRPLPHLRCRDLCGRRLHPFSRSARADPAGELAPRPAARRGCGPQRRRRRPSLHDAAVILVGAVRPVHPGHGLADRQSE